MTLPTELLSDLANLQQQTANAAPLSKASASVLKAIQLNAIDLEDDILSQLDVAAGNLDDPIMPADPGLMVTTFLTLFGNAQDQATLTTMYGYIGRSLLNLEQLIV